MKIDLKTALAALALTAGAAAAMPASAQSFDLGFGPQGGINFSYDSGGYCDPFGCPDDFWDMPVYYGPVFWEGQWYDGPLYYRDDYGRRQYWIHGGWRFDEWRGPHPGWWREGHYGPPLGMDFYRSHGFHGRWDHDGAGYGRGGYGPGLDRRDGGGFIRPDDRGRGGPPAMDQRRGPPPQAARGPHPQAAPRADGRGQGHFQRPPAAAPAAHGDRHRDDHH